MTTQFAGATTTAQSVVATYTTHSDAEAAVRKLAAAGLPVTSISIIGRNFEALEDIQGFYQPADAAAAGAGQGAWFGGLFGFIFGAFGFFVVPAVGLLLVLGPLSGLVAGAIGGAGVGALIGALTAIGIPKNTALKYQSRLQAGEFVVVVHEGPGEVQSAQEILKDTSFSSLEAHETNKLAA
jgi:hypothetical protein